jgi:DNA-binding CsgD family transcriptional regulator
MSAALEYGKLAKSDWVVLANEAPENMHAPPQTLLPAHILSVLESLRCGGFLLDLSGRVQSLNTMAFDCLGDGLMLGGKHLSATDRAADRRLQYLVGAALSQQELHARLSVTVPRSTRLPLVIRTVHLEPQAPELARSSGLLLLVLDPELCPDPPHDMLSETFGLTRAEADVATGIASGRTLAKIAAERGVKVGTARAHLKTVFSKTHTRGQADLTRVLTRLAFLVPRTESKIMPKLNLGQQDKPHTAGNGGYTRGILEPNVRQHENGHKEISSKSK